MHHKRRRGSSAPDAARVGCKAEAKPSRDMIAGGAGDPKERVMMKAGVPGRFPRRAGRRKHQGLSALEPKLGLTVRRSWDEENDESQS